MILLSPLIGKKTDACKTYRCENRSCDQGEVVPGGIGSRKEWGRSRGAGWICGVGWICRIGWSQRRCKGHSLMRG